MGSYAQCWLDSTLVGTTKNDIDVHLISLFQPKDKVILGPPQGELPRCLEHYRESIAEEPDVRLVYYAAPASVIKDRLAVLGYDLTTARQAFERWIEVEKSQQQELLDEYLGGEPRSHNSMEGHYRETVKRLSELTPDAWIAAMREVRGRGLEPNEFGRYQGPHENSLIGYMLSEGWYGFPGYDLLVPVRLALELADPESLLVYDLTDLVWSGYAEEADDFVAYGLRLSAEDYSANAKIVVLTEGKSDAWILQESLKHLYPHLIEYFSFLDFEGTGFGGGVGNLVNALRAFAGAGIVNNVIAMFDNDTAAQAATRAIGAANFPPNVVFRLLPSLEFLTSYPTIGPTGLVEMDVNGIAGSIELYLGEETLRSPSGEFYPVQWTGFDRALSKYQGEVVGKPEIQQRFRELLRSRRDPNDPVWGGLKQIFKMLFSAFTDKNRAAICKRPDEAKAR